MPRGERVYDMMPKFGNMSANTGGRPFNLASGSLATARIAIIALHLSLNSGRSLSAKQKGFKLYISSVDNGSYFARCYRLASPSTTLNKKLTVQRTEGTARMYRTFLKDNGLLLPIYCSKCMLDSKMFRSRLAPNHPNKFSTPCLKEIIKSV